jgi:hypothetical protein
MMMREKLLIVFLYYRSQFAASALVERYFSVREGKKGIIASAANISPGMDFGSALTGYNRSRPYYSAIRRFYSQILGV